MQMDMEMRGFSPASMLSYSTRVKYFQNHFNKSAYDMHENEVREFLHYQLMERRNLASSVNTLNATLRFLYDVTLDKPLSYRKVPRVKESRRIPILPSKEELATLFSMITNHKYYAMFMTIYGSGLRVSEAANLKINDIDSKNMRIVIRKGKCDKDRFALLPMKTLIALREYFKAYRPKEWLFENGRGGGLTTRAIQIAFETIVEKSGINKHMTVHTLRHAFATHLLNEGTNIFEIKKLMGHVRIDSTTWYLQLTNSQAMSLKSPLDNPVFSLPPSFTFQPHNG